MALPDLAGRRTSARRRAPRGRAVAPAPPQAGLFLVASLSALFSSPPPCPADAPAEGIEVRAETAAGPDGPCFLVRGHLAYPPRTFVMASVAFRDVTVYESWQGAYADAGGNYQIRIGPFPGKRIPAGLYTFLVYLDPQRQDATLTNYFGGRTEPVRATATLRIGTPEQEAADLAEVKAYFEDLLGTLERELDGLKAGRADAIAGKRFCKGPPNPKIRPALDSEAYAAWTLERQQAIARLQSGHEQFRASWFAHLFPEETQTTAYNVFFALINYAAENQGDVFKDFKIKPPPPKGTARAPIRPGAAEFEKVARRDLRAMRRRIGLMKPGERTLSSWAMTAEKLPAGQVFARFSDAENPATLEGDGVGRARAGWIPATIRPERLTGLYRAVVALSGRTPAPVGTFTVLEFADETQAETAHQELAKKWTSRNGWEAWRSAEFLLLIERDPASPDEAFEALKAAVKGL
jgi:hypothetical protein